MVVASDVESEEGAEWPAVPAGAVAVLALGERTELPAAEAICSEERVAVLADVSASLAEAREDGFVLAMTYSSGRFLIVQSVR